MSGPDNNANATQGTTPQGGVEVFLCGSCNRQYNSRAALEQHYHDAAAHGSVPPVTCNVCGREYCSQKALEQHYRDAAGHEADPTLNVQGAAAAVVPIYCPTCGRKYTSQKALEQHWKDTVRHGPSASDPVASNETNANTPSQQTDDMLRCSACTRRFRTRQALKHHCTDTRGHAPLVPDGDV
ncbi:hypothetical protein NEOLEDRAFT_1176209 [Neolentinus lepideus HHB14362 ss-1]|uniref:C2H2-type domain-containing protein n=1 Tax=Neolentinus lepideus HHB14362 ss-1 TaxID=1314782 RepID=A0A165UEX7_9AGAM|nr:hypothetical protein NEOLEDRAFT_1176209 [Neolentinus lepideus HHB14362 ss-1]